MPRAQLTIRLTFADLSLNLPESSYKGACGEQRLPTLPLTLEEFNTAKKRERNKEPRSVHASSGSFDIDRSSQGHRGHPMTYDSAESRGSGPSLRPDDGYLSYAHRRERDRCDTSPDTILSGHVSTVKTADSPLTKPDIQSVIHICHRCAIAERIDREANLEGSDKAQPPVTILPPASDD